MEPLTTAALIAGGSSLVGGLLGSHSQKQTNATNVNLARENRKWQEQQATTSWNRQMMAANTTHQREVNDLRKAGLNPILAAGGSGAPAPSASMGSGAQVTVQDPVRAGMEAGGSAAEMSRKGLDRQLLKEEVKNKKYTGDLISAQAFKAMSEGNAAEMNAEKIRRILPEVVTQIKSEIRRNQSSARNTEQQTRQLEEQLISYMKEADIDETEYGEILRYVRRFSQSIQGLSGSIGLKDR